LGEKNGHDAIFSGVISAGDKTNEKPVSHLKKVHKCSTGDYVLVDEDFSLFKAGSEEEPDTEYLGISGDPYIDDSFTHQPGWSTNYASQAGGACAIATPIGGMLNTPVGDYSGIVTISFRAKALNSSANMGVVIAKGGIWQPEALNIEYARIAENDVPGVGDMDDSGWKHFSFTFTNTYSSNDCFVQFCAYYCSVLLDDIKITVDDSSFIAAPLMLPATDFVADGFTAHWSDVRVAEKYLFSLYHEDVVSEVVKATYDFDNANYDGWSLEDIEETTDNLGYNGSSAPVVTRNSYLVSPEYDGRLSSVMIWMRNVGDDASSAKVILQGFDGRDWVDNGTIFCDMIPSDSEGGTLLINAEKRPSFYNKFKKIRFAFLGWDYDAEEGISPKLVIDNVQVETLPGVERKYDIKEEETTACERVLTGLDPETDYYYEVASVKGELKEWSLPALAFGISTPETQPASEVTPVSYTANWKYTPKASLYRVRDLGVTIADRNESDHVVLDEEFGVVAGGELEEPLALDNNFTPCEIDDYTVMPGWVGASTIIANGMVGAGGGGFAYLQTPELTLSNNNGDFHIEITVVCLGDDGIYITPSHAVGEYPGFEAAEGENTVELYYSKGSSAETLRISSGYGMPFYVKSLKVYQDLNAGDRVYTYFASKVVDGKDLSYKFENVNFDDYPIRAYDVMSIYNKDFQQCTSERSPYVIVNSQSGISSAESGAADMIVSSSDGNIVLTASEPTTATICSVDGIVIKSLNVEPGETACVPVGRGIFIVKTPGSAVKIMVI